MDHQISLQARIDVLTEYVAKLEGKNLALRAVVNVVRATHPDRAAFVTLLGAAERQSRLLVPENDVHSEAKLDGVREAFREFA